MIETAVIFKSITSFFEKEKSGAKPNTVRKLYKDDVRFTHLRNDCKKITIIESGTGREFTREITDYTEWDGLAIISWKQ